MRERNLIGSRFGFLTVVARVGRDEHRHVIWEVECDCGNHKQVLGQALRNNKTRSCGCKYAELRGPTHGQKLPAGEASFRALFKYYQDMARKRGLSFDLSEEQFRKIVDENCTYCGKPPSRLYKASKRSNGGYLCNGVDRVDNEKGYFSANCVPCCSLCNRIKSDMTLQQLRETVLAMASQIPYYEKLVSNSGQIA